METGLCDKKTRYVSLIRVKHSEYSELSDKLDTLIPMFNNALHDLTKELADKYNEREKNDTSFKKIDVRINGDQNEKPEEDDEVTINFPDKKQFNVDRNNKESNKVIDSSLDFELNKIINKLYYKISKHIHPDKTDDEMKIAYFNYCKKSKEEKILYKLILVAEKFNINYIFGENYYKIIDDEIKMIAHQINKIQSNVVFLWEEQNDADKKRDILLKYLRTNFK